MLAPISWRTPPRHYGPWEKFVYMLTEELVKKGVNVTLFATGDSQTSGNLHWICPRPYSEDISLDAKVWECLHVSEVFENSHEFDLIHNNFDFLPLTYSSLVKTPILTTIHGFSSSKILPVYCKYNKRVNYVSISNADRSPQLDYIATIYHGIYLEEFPFQPIPDNYLLFYGRIHPDKGTREAIEVAKTLDKPLIIAGIIQDEEYYEKQVFPCVDNKQIQYIGPVGAPFREKLLGGATALLHLINFAEPFGLSVIEAMACGTPVIAMNKGSMPEVILNEKTGWLVNNIDQAVDKVKRVKDINRKECRKWVESKFSVNRMVDEYILIYKKILRE